MMEMAIILLALGLAAVAVALAVARIRAQRRTAETARDLMESHREFEDSIDKLIGILIADQNFGGASGRSSQNGGSRARPVSQNGRAACAGSGRYGSPQSAYRTRRNRIRFAENYSWEDEWTPHEDDAYERALRLA